MTTSASAACASLDAAIDAALITLRAAGVAGEVSCTNAEHWSADVRLGAIETVRSAATCGLRIVALGEGGRSATCTGSDLSPAAVRAIATKAAELSAWSDPDPWNALPPREACGPADADLDLVDPVLGGIDRDTLVGRAIDGERSAFAVDPRVRNSHRSGAWTRCSSGVYATTDGVRVHRAQGSVGFHVMVVAEDGGERQVGYHGTSARHVADLKTSTQVGTEAGRRAVRGFGWKRLPSAAMPVVLHQDVASELLGTLASAISGSAVYRGSTYLAASRGEPVASAAVAVIDDPLIRRGLGSRRCDGEGVRSRALTLVEGGVLRSFLVDAYAARRLGHPLTGHCGGTSNLRLVPGQASFDDLLRAAGDGLLVTQFHGKGVDLASGTFSKGVSGFRIQGGRLTHPVQEVTIAGNLKELLPGIRLVGDDPLEQHATASPSLLVDGFMVGGS